MRLGAIFRKTQIEVKGPIELEFLALGDEPLAGRGVLRQRGVRRTVAGAADPVLASLIEVWVIELGAAAWWRRRLEAGARP